jgi:hypothetical protein
MKLVLLLAFALFGNATENCHKQAHQAAQQTAQTAPKAMETEKKPLSLSVTANKTDAQTLSLTYRVENVSQETFVLLNRLPNRGADTQSVGPNKVYVVPQTDGSVEISKRAIFPPENIDPVALILPLGMKLAPGKSYSETVTLSLPLNISHPYPSGLSTKMPAQPSRVQICLGYLPASAATRDAEIRGEKLVFASVAALQKQELACAGVSF